jgi:hypothetical protein
VPETIFIVEKNKGEKIKALRNGELNLIKNSLIRRMIYENQK